MQVAAAPSRTKYVVAISVLAAALALVIALMAWLQRHKLRNTLVRVSRNMRRMLAGGRTKPLNHSSNVQPVRHGGPARCISSARLLSLILHFLVTGGRHLAAFSAVLLKSMKPNHQIFGPPLTLTIVGRQIAITLGCNVPNILVMHPR
jgi:hypothetical protein